MPTVLFNLVFGIVNVLIDKFQYRYYIAIHNIHPKTIPVLSHL